MLKCFIALMTALTVSVCFSETLKIAYFEQEPSAYKLPNGKVGGVAVDYFEQYFAPKMGVTVEWVGLPVNRIYIMLEKAEVDAYISSVKNPERQQKYLFPAHYYALAKPTLTLLKTSPIKQITNQEDLFDLKIGYVDGALCPPFMNNDRIKLDMIKGGDYKKVNFDKLLLNRIDAILDLSEYANQYEAKILGISDKIKVILLPIDPTPIYTIFAKTDKGVKMVKLYDSVNETLYNTDAYNKATEKYK